MFIFIFNYVVLHACLCIQYYLFVFQLCQASTLSLVRLMGPLVYKGYHLFIDN